ncbi:MAG: hypothetical protein IT376_14030 [Polyangiaceae bacterium]|nr:hypothetical protein [Polyangiaceae bacterium]
MASLDGWLRALSGPRLALGVLFATGCAAAAPAAAPAGAARPAAAADAALWRPPAQDRAASGAVVVTLLEPPAPDAIRAVVRAFFEAVRAESPAALERLARPGASARTSRGGRRELVSAYQARFARLDYSGVRYADAVRRARTTLAPPPSPGDGARRVRVEIDPPAATDGGVRLFGPAVVLLLEVEGSGYKIAQVEEDFDLP